MTQQRCPWVDLTKPDYVAYHDEEWGVPVWDDHTMFEYLTLESAQAGLSWYTVLRKRPNYRKAFARFDPAKVARFTPARIEKLVLDPGIVRHRQKIASVVTNARAFLDVQREHGSFDAHLWSFVGGRPVQGVRARMGDVPARTEISDALSKDLRRRGFSFVGSTILQAYMQAVGLVNDHLVGCFRHRPVSKMR